MIQQEPVYGVYVYNCIYIYVGYGYELFISINGEVFVQNAILRTCFAKVLCIHGRVIVKGRAQIERPHLECHETCGKARRFGPFQIAVINREW